KRRQRVVTAFASDQAWCAPHVARLSASRVLGGESTTTPGLVDLTWLPGWRALRGSTFPTAPFERHGMSGHQTRRTCLLQLAQQYAVHLGACFELHEFQYGAGCAWQPL